APAGGAGAGAALRPLPRARAGGPRRRRGRSCARRTLRGALDAGPRGALAGDSPVSLGAGASRLRPVGGGRAAGIARSLARRGGGGGRDPLGSRFTLLVGAPASRRGARSTRHRRPRAAAAYAARSRRALSASRAPADRRRAVREAGGRRRRRRRAVA